MDFTIGQNVEFDQAILKSKAEKLVRRVLNSYDERHQEYKEGEINKVNAKAQFYSSNFIAFLFHS